MSSIARAYGLSWQTLAQLNRLADPDYIEVGQSIMIPFTQGKASSKTPPRAMAARVSPDRALGWPTEGVLGRGFGLHDGRLHRGIDISAPKGTPIVAAADGLVIYSGPGLDGYGNIVMLDHEGGLTTMYAHNDRNTVRVGERVRRGQLVALVGETGRAWGTHVHFEVHRQGWLVDPRPWLP
ncbi:MAG: peptidoglycan DD-metalloendopeptidase family protein [Nitrospinae bacterium]|nr:peptidoglycan DD-metalloendopeptidase family protein [Nitrospinota bacterium]